ncbi:MAG: FAD-binding protein [Chloroflexota bacterium]|nr:FAD-binding protein [Chloroflexota bacterium]
MTSKQGNSHWDAEVDVIVVGFGGAGACAALEADQQGASVLVLDRCHGGGATAASGAIVYAGGGTSYQKAVGYDDTPEEMYKYLKQEVGDVMSDETLRRFCEESTDMIRWLEEAGVPFEASLCPFKTSYPTDDYYLYYSGSENNGKYKANAKPAPRGHRAKGKGISGLALFHALEKAIRSRGIQVRCQTQVQRLVIADDGRVIGVEGRSLRQGFISARVHGFLTTINAKANTYAPPVGKMLNAICATIWKLRSRPYRALAHKGVILAAGGFIFSKEMVQKHNPIFLRCLPLGTYADDGGGIRLGESAGGATAQMDKMSAWRFYVPPEALMQGVLVNKQGQRICSEDLYGGKQGDYIVDNGGDACLIFDSKTYKEAVSHFGDQCAFFQKLTMIPMVRISRKKDSSFAKLATKIGVSPQGLEDTMSKYNDIARKGEPDPLGKMEKRFVPQDTPPFYALDCSLQGLSLTKMGIPTAAMTLGGLVVNEETGQVKREDGSSIEGLYAAGRNAVGLCSNSYFASGSSIADCVFAGRRAARHAADLSAK